MKNIIRFSRSIFVILSFTLLVLSGCGGGSGSSPTEAFTANQVSGASNTPAIYSATATPRGKIIGVPTEKGRLTVEQLNTITTVNGLQVLTGTAKCDVKVVQINYQTPGVQPGEMTNSSAAVLIPSGDDVSCKGPLPLIAFARGTKLDKVHTNADPSDPSTQLLMTFFASQGYAVVATDLSWLCAFQLSVSPLHTCGHGSKCRN